MRAVTADQQSSLSVRAVTGAPARSFRDWVTAHADSFRKAGG